MRLSLFRTFLACSATAAALLTAAPATAQQPDPASAPPLQQQAAATTRPLELVLKAPYTWPAAAPQHRPAALAPLYVSLVSVNILDVDSTYDALRARNGREANPLLSGLVGRPAVFIAVKAGTTAASIWTAEKLWKKHRVAAVAIMGVTNVALAAVVANNYRVARR